MIEYALLISLMVVFLHVCTREGMILARVPELLWNAPVWLKKPLYDCPVCMSPWWGSVFIAVFGLLTGYWPHWWVWVCQIMAAGGISAVLAALLTPAPESRPWVMGEPLLGEPWPGSGNSRPNDEEVAYPKPDTHGNSDSAGNQR